MGAFVVELELILVARPEFVQALHDQRLEIRAEQVERGQLTRETGQILTFGRAADVAFIEHVGRFNAPRAVRSRDQLAIDVAMNATLAPALVLMRKGNHIPLKQIRKILSILRHPASFDVPLVV